MLGQLGPFGGQRHSGGLFFIHEVDVDLLGFPGVFEHGFLLWAYLEISVSSVWQSISGDYIFVFFDGVLLLRLVSISLPMTSGFVKKLLCGFLENLTY
nr:hypothetical protein Itr_chr07CG07950 [Ipomoea trifida]GMD17816.1 hypothetical protein Iba_chr07dCG7240 [Ipomoea batatas]